MDRRVAKTRKAIFDGFDRLMSRKAYGKITIQDILDEADIGRSTFYAHFETKDELLEVMCRELMEHIFFGHVSDSAYEKRPGGLYDNCTFEECVAGGCEQSLNVRVEHICRHLFEQRDEIMRIMRYESRDIYLRYFSENIHRLFEKNPDFGVGDVPRDFIEHNLTEGFVSTVKWWVDEKMQTPPEKVAKYFCIVNNI